MTAKQQLADLVKRLKDSATAYRRNADTQDRESIHVEILADLPEEEAVSALAQLMKIRPKWFLYPN